VDGLQVLAQLKGVPGCRACVGILVHAKTDDEWKAQWDVPQFVAATKDAVADVIDLDKLGAQVTALLRGKAASGDAAVSVVDR
jgi:hypothetical protein